MIFLVVKIELVEHIFQKDNFIHGNCSQKLCEVFHLIEKLKETKMHF